MSKSASPPAAEGEMQVGAGEVRREALREEVLKFVGFGHDQISPNCVRGRFVVNENCCQVSGVLHGGICAMIAESVASIGAIVASGFQRAAGLQLSINHLNPAPLGTEVFVYAKPAQLGKRIQVWDVTFSKLEDSTIEKDEMGSKIATSRVTLMVGLTGQAKEYYGELRARL